VVAVGKKCAKSTTLVPVNRRGLAGQRGETGQTGQAATPAPTYSTGSGLTLSGTTFGADMTKLQARIAGSGCAADQALQSVGQTGVPACASLHGYQAKAGATASAAMAVPPGNWVLLGQITAGLSNTDMTMNCEIDVNGSPVAHGSQFVAAHDNGTVSAMGTATTTALAGTSVAINCSGPGGLPFWSNGTISAIPLAALN
jgi:hypothetical protein